MKQATKTRRPLSVKMQYRLREGLFLITVALALFLLVSLLSYHSTDPGWLSTGYKGTVQNWGGYLGAWLADFMLSLFGIVSYLFIPLIVFMSWLGLRFSGEEGFSKPKFPLDKSRLARGLRGLGFLCFLMSSCGLVSLVFQTNRHVHLYFGGILGELTVHTLSFLLNSMSTALFLTTLWLCSVTFLTGLSWLGLVDALGEHVIRLLALLREKFITSALPALQPDEPIERDRSPGLKAKLKNVVKIIQSEQADQDKPKLTIKLPEPQKMLEHKPLTKSQEKNISSVVLAPGTLPPLTLLNAPAPLQEKAFAHTTFEELSHLVETRLSDFGVEAKVVAVYPGPVITRFELELAPGIKVSKITSLSKDIARSLSTVSVRVVEVIPGKSVIGLEIPNENREVVTLREILESQKFTQSRSPISLALGKDIAGAPIVVDLFKMPHLLVAGTTGSGKSVSLNAMLLSMLFKAPPDQLKLILIDPKMLELSVYEGIPHLLTPVITDMKNAANALRWCVAEMDKRYRLMSTLGVRNLQGYNQKVGDALRQGSPIPVPVELMASCAPATHLELLPTIVVIADELADMMMVVGKKVEDLIARIAQKARAAGIHLILATQRPSVDVITGLIKANIPTRMAFQVSSRIDSRTILDQQGAEQLLGHGDMLYLPPGAGIPVRIHGAYVADEEVHKVVAAWRTYGQPEYIYEVTEDVAEAGSNAEDGGEQDPLYDQAVRVVTESRRASISLVQRRLRIGYNRAARMMEDMEAAGVVGAMDGSGLREVLAPAVE